MVSPMTEPLFSVSSRERAFVTIFGERYDLRRPDEGTKADTADARKISIRIATVQGKRNPSDRDWEILTQDARRLVLLLCPSMPEHIVKFLTLSELAGIADAWARAYEARDIPTEPVATVDALNLERGEQEP